MSVRQHRNDSRQTFGDASDFGDSPDSTQVDRGADGALRIRTGKGGFGDAAGFGDAGAFPHERRNRQRSDKGARPSVRQSGR